MPQNIDISSLFYFNNPCIPLLDVRSPIEYHKGHIPKAQSFPLFTDEERSIIGTLYKQEGFDTAYLKGLEIVGPKMKDFVQDGFLLAGNDQEIALYCARGGKRSQSMQWLLEQSGLKVHRLEGGYKMYRNWTISMLNQKYQTVVLSGLTGVGKTKILQALHQIGTSCIDLEEIAKHKGSAFGGNPNQKQPSQQQFENELALQLLQKQEDVFVLEDESKSIGRCFLTPFFVEQNIKKAPTIRLLCSIEQRVNNLLEEYGQLEQNILIHSVRKLEKRLGKQKTDFVIKNIENNDLSTAISLVLEYYDARYHQGMMARNMMCEIDITNRSIQDVAQEIATKIDNTKDQNTKNDNTKNDMGN